ncbi:uncharacterized protein LOC132725804 isoform X2 [Ruditapes philippinarum]|nr:uncharacterized protein LOC132725804 isoform X2 [Ruditapes philippinarum]
MIQTLMEQNRRLTLKNKQLRKVWEDMQNICESVNMLSCECDTKAASSLDYAAPFTFTNSVRQSSKPRNADVSLQIQTVRSNVYNGHMTMMSVSYMSTLDHVTEWVGLRENGGVWRTAGSRNTSDGTMFDSSVEIGELKKLRDLILFLYNEEENLSIRFNLTEIAVTVDREQIVMQPTEILITVDKRFQATNDTDFSISTTVYENVLFLKDFPTFEIYFTGVNDNSSEIFEIFSFNSDLIAVNMSATSANTTNMEIIVKQMIAKYGGILTVRFWSPMTGMLQDLYHGPIIQIQAVGTDDIVYNNTLGVFPLPKQTVISAPSSTLMCAAMGNPHPNVTIVKVINGPERNEIETKTELITRVNNMEMKVLTLNWDASGYIEGLYVCRATNGNKTVESETQVIANEDVVFNDTYTGVVQNDSNVIKLSCMATGKPKPELSLRLYSDYGPSLINAGEYKVWKEDVFVSRVSLTLAAEDGQDFHTIYCVASQMGGNHKHVKIDLFPYGQKTYNWDLYERIERMNEFL